MTTQRPTDNNLILLTLTKFAGVGPRQMAALLHRYGEPTGIMHADRASLSAMDGMTDDLVERIIGADRYLQEASGYRDQLVRRDIGLHTRLDHGYPQSLFELNNPPAVLYVRGKLPDAGGKSVTVVGAENATNEGIELTTTLARRAAEARVAVISSLRKGIEAAAHLGARAGEGVSFAVVSGGFDFIDAAEQMPLAIDITRGGGVISEQSPEEKPLDKGYHHSNRLMVGLARAVVVTEIYRDSTAALDLLSFCNETGKLTFVLIDPRHGALADETSLSEAVRCGAIPMVGLDKIDDIFDALV